MLAIRHYQGLGLALLSGRPQPKSPCTAILVFLRDPLVLIFYWFVLRPSAAHFAFCQWPPAATTVVLGTLHGAGGVSG